MNTVINTATSQVVTALGVATLLMSDVSPEDPRRVVTFLRRIIPPAMLDQFDVFTGPRDEPTALITWAWITPETLRSLTERPIEKLHLSEWREGSIPLIADLFVRTADMASLRDLLSRSRLGDEDHVYWICRRNSKVRSCSLRSANKYVR